MIQFTYQHYVKQNFYNKGVTKTSPGHVALLTGVYTNIDNSGKELPHDPSFMHAWLRSNNVINLKSAIITSKDKLEVLKYVDNPIWWYVQKPYSNCGNYGLGSGYRHDSITYKAALKILEVDTPNLAIISFREPDFSAHKQDYESYIKGIQEVDGYIGGIWDFLQKNVEYSEKTTLIITNDHGRHLDTVSNGFISHGDNCQGCQRLMFMASGPDFKAGVVDTISREQIDLAPTISYLLGLSNIEYKGSIMDELLKE